MKRLATLLVAAGLALVLVAFISNFSTAWAWGWRHYYPCYGGYMHHYPYAYYPYWRCQHRWVGYGWY